MQDGDVISHLLYLFTLPTNGCIPFHSISFPLIVHSYNSYISKLNFFSCTIFRSCSDMSHDVSSAAAAVSAEGECSGLLLAQAVLPSVTAA